VIANFADGSHSWQKVTKTFTSPAAYDSIRYLIIYSKTSGTVWFDGASLVKMP
jgi:hypothetical protein